MNNRSYGSVLWRIYTAFLAMFPNMVRLHLNYHAPYQMQDILLRIQDEFWLDLLQHPDL